MLGKQRLEKLKVLNKYCSYNKALKLCNDRACPLADRISVNVELEQKMKHTVLSSKSCQEGGHGTGELHRLLQL